MKNMSFIKSGVAASIVSVFSLTAQSTHAQLLSPDVLKDETGLPLNNIIDILTHIMQWMLALVSVLAVISFVISGILYLTAGGDEDQLGRARRAFVGAIFGVIVSLVGLIVIQAVQKVLSGEGTVF